MNIEKTLYAATPAGDSYAYTLRNDHGYAVTITDFGGGVVSLLMPDKAGHVADVALARAPEELGRFGPMGATIGRFANRIANGRFTLNNKTYQLYRNDSGNTLHGGREGFGHKMWQAATDARDDLVSVTLTYVSPDGEENFPGQLTLRVTYSLSADNRFTLSYQAVSTKDTILNVTNHVYFNLNGHNVGDVRNHLLWVDADYITPVIDVACIPTGELMDVTGTPFDLRVPKLIGDGLAALPFNIQMQYGHGYDHNFVLNTTDAARPCCTLYEQASGRKITVYTDQPGMQVYTSNGVNITGKDGAHYGSHQAVCLETQHYPDCVNHPNFPGCILRAGEMFTTVTTYALSCE